jgi:hypothetical protein
VKRYVNNERVAFYLDGPEGFEWIFRNQIIERREQQIYVDYIQAEDRHHWSGPVRFLWWFSPYSPPEALNVARSLVKSGLCTPVGLEVVARAWRTFQITDSTTWGELRQKNFETVRSLETCGSLRSLSNDQLGLIINRWAFPLYALDLTEDRNVSLGELRRVREEAEAAWIAREVGYADWQNGGYY